MMITNKQSDWPSEKNPLLVLHGDVREIVNNLPDNSVQCVVTSPPYWGVRDYGTEGQIGAETDLLEYVETLTKIFHDIRRVLKPDGTFWLNIGNTYTSGGRKWQE